MTQREAAQIERLMGLMSDMQAQLATLTERIEGLCELRAANGALMSAQFQRVEDRCNERHGELVRRVDKLEREERRTYGWRERVTGMGVPVALLVSIVSVILTVVR